MLFLKPQSPQIQQGARCSRTSGLGTVQSFLEGHRAPCSSGCSPGLSLHLLSCPSSSGRALNGAFSRPEGSVGVPLLGVGCCLPRNPILCYRSPLGRSRLSFQIPFPTRGHLPAGSCRRAATKDKRKTSLLRVSENCHGFDFLLLPDDTNTDVRGVAALANWRPGGTGHESLSMGPLNQKSKSLICLSHCG